MLSTILVLLSSLFGAICLYMSEVIKARHRDGKASFALAAAFFQWASGLLAVGFAVVWLKILLTPAGT